MADIAIVTGGDLARLVTKIMKDRKVRVKPKYFCAYFTGKSKDNPKLGFIGCKSLIEFLPIDARGNPYAAEDYFLSDKKFINFISSIDVSVLTRVWGAAIGGTSLGETGALSFHNPRTAVITNLLVTKDKIQKTDKIENIVKYLDERKEGLVSGVTIVHANKEDAERDKEIDRLIESEILTFLLYAAKKIGVAKVVREGFELEKIREHYGTIICGSALFHVQAQARGITHINVNKTPILDSTRVLIDYLKGESTEYCIPGVFIFGVSLEEKVSRGITSELRRIMNNYGIPVLGETMIASEEVKQSYGLVLYLLDPAYLEKHPILYVLEQLWGEKIKLLGVNIRKSFVRSVDSLETELRAVIAIKRVSEDQLKELLRRFHNAKNLAKTVLILEGDEDIEEYTVKFELIAEILAKLNEITKLEKEVENTKRKIRTLKIKLMVLKLEGKKAEAIRLEKEIANYRKKTEEKIRDIESIWRELEEVLGKKEVSKEESEGEVVIVKS